MIRIKSIRRARHPMDTQAYSHDLERKRAETTQQLREIVREREQAECKNS
jgi:hypothetical protein